MAQTQAHSGKVLGIQSIKQRSQLFSDTTEKIVIPEALWVRHGLHVDLKLLGYRMSYVEQRSITTPSNLRELGV